MQIRAFAFWPFWLLWPIIRLAILAMLTRRSIVAEMSATDAKNKFGELLEMARTEPVAIQKNGRNVAYVVSAEQFQQLTADGNAPRVNPLVVKLHGESVKRWGKVYEALAK